MKRSDRIKLDFVRNWQLPGKERLSSFLAPSADLKTAIKNGIVWLNNEDIAIHTTADNYIEWTILSTGTYEHEINKLIRISAREGDICIDIGGNIGLQSIRMARSVGASGHVYAFEPLEFLQAKFKKNIALNSLKNVSLLPFALSDTEFEAQFDIDENAWNQGTFSLSNSTGTSKQQVQVKVGDQVPEIAALEKLSLIKIDVEGYELPVLKGLQDTLTKHKPRLIFEYDHHHWKQTGHSIADCLDYLENIGYIFYQVTPVGCELLPSNSAAVGGNLFCLPINE